MLEGVIYATGVTVIMSVSIAIICGCVLAATICVKKIIVKELQSSWRHVALYYVMNKIMSSGLSSALNKVVDEANKINTGNINN
jgi:hypothetical protein